MKDLKTEKITFRTTTGTKNTLESLSKKQDRTISYIINSILNRHFSGNKSQPAPESTDTPSQSSWLKYSFKDDTQGDISYGEFLDSLKRILLYSPKAAENLVVIGYRDDAGGNNVMIPGNSNILGLDTLSGKYSKNYQGDGHSINSASADLILLFGDQSNFNVIQTELTQNSIMDRIL